MDGASEPARRMLDEWIHHVVRLERRTEAPLIVGRLDRHHEVSVVGLAKGDSVHRHRLGPGDVIPDSGRLEALHHVSSGVQLIEGHVPILLRRPGWSK